jgi:hypothetical protein
MMSTRHPDKLAAAIESARRASDGDRQPGDWESVG